MCRRADAARGKIDFTGIGFGIRDEFGNGPGGHCRINFHYIGHADDAPDRRDITDEIETELVVERCVNRVRYSGQKQRITVCWCTHRCLCGDIAAGTRPIVYNEWLAEPLRQPLSYEACREVSSAARGVADDDPDRPRRIALRPGDP